MFKKLRSSLLVSLLTISAAVAPLKSQAAIIVGFGGGAIGFSIADQEKRLPGQNVGVGILIGTMVVGTGLIVGSVIAPPAAIPLIILSEDIPQNEQSIESHLSEKYKFISDREVVKDLATLIVSKTSPEKIAKEEYSLLNISENEVKEVLSVTDLSDKEISTIVSDLTKLE